MDKCIYCFTDKKLTKSHVIPEGLGSNLKLLKAVCLNCNSEHGRTFEAQVCKDLSFYRMLLQLESKGKVAKTEAEMNILGHKITVSVGKKGLPQNVKPIIEEGLSRKFLVSAESPNKLKQKMKAFIKGGYEFDEDKMTETSVQLVFKGEQTKIDSLNFLRLAAKIAFEKFCMFRGTQAYDSEFNHIRSFIKEGKYGPEFVVNLIYENTLMNQVIGLPFPLHSILSYGSGKEIGAIVTIFGLFNYFVLLSSNACVIQDWDEYMIIHPQTKKDTLPLLTGKHSISTVHNLIAKSLKDKNSGQKAKEFARQKFTRSIQDYFRD